MSQAQTGEDGYPLDKRRSTGDDVVKAKIKMKIENPSLLIGMEIDNR